MKTPYLILFLSFLLVLSCPTVAFADVEQDLKQEIDTGIGDLDFSGMQQVASPFIGDVVEKIRQIINGEFDNVQSFWQLLMQLFVDGIAELFPQLISILVVLVVLGLVRNAADGLISPSTNNVVNFVGVAVISVVVLSMVVKAYEQVYALISQIAALTEVSMPILLTLLVANGGNALSSVCQPMLAMFSGVVVQLVKNAILPLSVFAMIFAIVNNISSNVRVGKMQDFLSGTATWLLGVIFMLFSAFTSVQGISAASIDGISVRAAKFATKNYIPLLGGYLADGFDIVVASTTLIKNAFGACVLLALLFMVIKPLLTIVCINVGLQAVTAFAEPITEDKYVKMLGGICKSLTFLAVLVLAVAFMGAILVVIAICCANGV